MDSNHICFSEFLSQRAFVVNILNDISHQLNNGGGIIFQLCRHSTSELPASIEHIYHCLKSAEQMVFTIQYQNPAKFNGPKLYLPSFEIFFAILKLFAFLIAIAFAQSCIFLLFYCSIVHLFIFFYFYLTSVCCLLVGDLFLFFILLFVWFVRRKCNKKEYWLCFLYP